MLNILYTSGFKGKQALELAKETAYWKKLLKKENIDYLIESLMQRMTREKDFWVRRGNIQMG